MAIAKMMLVNIDGDVNRLDDAVLRCSYKNNFHPEQASSFYESMGAIQSSGDENPYTSILHKLADIGMHAGIDITTLESIGEGDVSINHIPLLPEKIKGLKKSADDIRELIEALEGEPCKDDDIFASDKLKFRFGRMPVKSYKKMKKMVGKSFFFYPLLTEHGYEWGVYLTARSVVKSVDKIFVSLNFERLSVPPDILSNPQSVSLPGSPDVNIDRETLTKNMEDFDQAVLRLNQRKEELSEAIAQNEQALIQLSHIENLDVTFDDLFSCEYIKIRFGRMPKDSFGKLKYYDEKLFIFYPFDNDGEYYWGVYFTPEANAAEVDSIFNSFYFERLRFPDSVHGTPEEARAALTRTLSRDKDELSDVLTHLKAMVNKRKLYFYETYSRVKVLSDSFDMRKYVSIIDDTFHIVGFVPADEADEFKESFETVDGVTATLKPPESDVRFTPPTKLKNCRLFKPFEMFVDMFGLPAYNDIDPTVYVGITYMLLFGVMFGDLGQGLVISLVGFIMWKLKKMVLGRVMIRIGFVSAIFGTIYGSVFGYEHLLDPMFHALGFAEKPIEVLSPSMTNIILIGAIALGVFIIIASITINIIMGIKQKNPERAFFSQNGLAGLIFYVTVIVCAVSTLVFKVNLLIPAVIIPGIVVPILIVFFKEPLTHLATNGRAKKKKADEAKQGGDAEKKLETNPVIEGLGLTFDEAFKNENIVWRLGRLPVDGMWKLKLFDGKLFSLYTLDSDDEYNWCVYFAAKQDIREADSVFNGLVFERIVIPADQLAVDSAFGKISEIVAADKAAHRKTLSQKAKGEGGIGSFIIENFFELFEVVLSFITNTMSFLRVGGFILSHAGMMAVVMTLSEMVGEGASPIVVIIGNIFVLGMEGLIVGIQSLRLEFYEIFSRFFEGDGKPFTPISVGNAQNEQ